MNKVKKMYFVLVLLFFAPQLNAQTYNGDEKEIEKILTSVAYFSDCLVNKEMDKLVACYTKDAKIFPNKQNILEGIEGLKQYWVTPKDVQIVQHKITPIEITIENKTAYDYGYYEGTTRRPDGSEISWKGKYVIVWKKVEGEWKIYLDIWNEIAG